MNIEFIPSLYLVPQSCGHDCGVFSLPGIGRPSRIPYFYLFTDVRTTAFADTGSTTFIQDQAYTVSFTADILNSDVDDIYQVYGKLTHC